MWLEDFAQMFASTFLFTGGSLGRDPELTSDPCDISSARKTFRRHLLWLASWRGYATPYVAIQYRSSIDHFRVAPIGGQLRRFGAPCGTRDAYSGQSNWPVSPFGFFSQNPGERKRAGEKEREREKEPMKGRVIEGLDGLFIRSTRWLLPSRGFGLSVLWLRRSYICSAKGPLSCPEF